MVLILYHVLTCYPPPLSVHKIIYFITNHLGKVIWKYLYNSFNFNNCSLLC